MLRSMLFASVSCLALALTGCGHSHDPEGFDTYQECFDDHHVEESLSVHDAIVVCCLEHPIAGVAPACGATEADCTTYLGTNLAATSATSAEVMTSCTDYVAELEL